MPLALPMALLSRIEDASLNASAPRQQRWMDGWIVRTSPGKARRARCVNAVAPGRLALEEKLALVAAVFVEAGLPMVVRITPFTQPPGLDALLVARGYTQVDDTRVMVLPQLHAGEPPPMPAGLRWRHLAPAAFATAVGALRGSSAAHMLAHADRLVTLPVPCDGYAIEREGDGQILACGQTTREADIVGLYDVHTHDSARGLGLATLLCKRLLALQASAGASIAYLQTEIDNETARRIYHCLGFADQYGYHYRQPPT